jgi:hypothetical protein
MGPQGISLALSIVGGIVLSSDRIQKKILQMFLKAYMIFNITLQLSKN